MDEKTSGTGPDTASRPKGNAAEYHYQHGIHDLTISGVPRSVRLSMRNGGLANPPLHIAMLLKVRGWFQRILAIMFRDSEREKRRKAISEKYINNENVTADEMEVLRRDWSERFRLGVTDEGYARQKIIRIPRDAEGCLDWCFPMPRTESEWQEMADGLGIPVADLKI